VRVKLLFGFFVLTGALLAQNKTITINDSDGNQTVGTINNGNVYFQDSHGNSAFGTIRDANVYLSTSGGDMVFGTIKYGNVFLTDQKGTTTGTIRNGNIFLSNSNGSTTTGTYTKSGNINTTTSPAPESIDQQLRLQQLQQLQQEQDAERQKEIRQRNYDAGAAVGQAIGADIVAAMESHRITSYCKANPTSVVHLNNGISVPCPNAPLSSYDQTQIDCYCADHPGLWIEIGRHRTDCNHAPDHPNMAWATWELKAWNWDYKHQNDKGVRSMELSSDQIRADWEYWRGTYCALSPGEAYKDLGGKKQRCN